ncbi:MAG: exopolysaccharide biosynthesis polyprenyl glycosylphosphotransferase [Pseudomonadota bacterium]|uniref:exopolysaccharide biosynthesis polyprenyl glycosylphosphotransferase n=1 Tax=Phenylobacterium sp. Root700 TaxID=1736591 RepID=UPI0026F428F9|nr:exopolysaccharide biosynthesis polyprenyl glycosylphosphotransferase [Phenylobacterium sp. Root700]
MRLSGRVLTRFFQAGDALALILGGVMAAALTHGANVLLIYGGAAVATFASLRLFDCYKFGRREDLATHLMRVTVCFAVAVAMCFAILTHFVGVVMLAASLGVWTPMAFLAVAAAHGVWWLNVKRWRANGRLTPNLVVVGATGAAERLIAAVLDTREANVLGVFDDRVSDNPPQLHGVPLLGGTDELLAHRIMPYVDRIVLTVPSGARDRVHNLLERLIVLPNEITLLLDQDGEADEAEAIDRIANIPLTRISGDQIDQGKAIAKRAQDIVVGSLALFIAAPIMLMVAAAVKLDSPGPIFFRQRRHGFNNEEIVVWKFRSMRTDAEDAKAARQISVGDDRVTKVGAFIRKTSLDELPQLINVLTGEMSLVGPRPHAIGMKTGQVESSRLVSEYAHRHRMKPGMTGWAAINGSRGAVDTPELVRARVALDVEYIERQSFWLDLYIMFMTVPCLLGDSETVR